MPVHLEADLRGASGFIDRFAAPPASALISSKPVRAFDLVASSAKSAMFDPFHSKPSGASDIESFLTTSRDSPSLPILNAATAVVSRS